MPPTATKNRFKGKAACRSAVKPLVLLKVLFSHLTAPAVVLN
jgi:hypothetical protein